MEIWSLQSELALSPIFLRARVVAFWNVVMELLRSEHHVVVIGSPGVGKTSTHPYLLRLLLQTRRPVVFLVRGKDLGGTYYEFRPKDGGGYEAFEYDEADVKMQTIPALTDSNAFFIIEPAGQRSPPHYWVKARIALVCSPNRKHFKGMEKTGTFEFGAVTRYFPLWSLDEVLEARPYMLDAKKAPIVRNDTNLKELVFHYGPIVRILFSLTISEFEASQARAISKLSEDQVKLIVEALDSNTAIEIDASNDGAPSSLIVAYESEYPFDSVRIVIVSDFVKSEIWRRYSTLLRRRVKFGESRGAWQFFEAHCRFLIAHEADAAFEIRDCVGKREQATQKKQQNTYYIPRSRDVKWTIEKVDATLKLQNVDLQPGTLYHSSSETQELVDAIVMREDGGVDGFQFTLAMTHDCISDSLSAFASKFGKPGLPFRLYYAVPCENFKKFITNPVKPLAADAEVYHLSVPVISASRTASGSSSSSSSSGVASASATAGSDRSAKK